jgi:hypothetical protein
LLIQRVVSFESIDKWNKINKISKIKNYLIVNNRSIA